MPASNIARYYFALQSAKGTPAAAPQYSIDVTSADLTPTVEIEQRSETGLGRDPGETYIRLLTAGGNVTTLLRPLTAPLFYYGVLGAKAASLRGAAWVASTARVVGDYTRPTSTANKNLFEVTVAGTTGTAEPTWPAAVGATVTDGTVTYINRGEVQNKHDNTPANDQPYMTWWRMVGDAIYERFDDCKITGLNAEWAAGGDVSAALGITGLDFEQLPGGIPAGAVHDTGTPFRVPGVVYTIDGAVDNSLTQGNLNIEANQTAIQTVNITPSYLEPAARSITLSWEQVFSTADRYYDLLYNADGTPRQEPYEGAATFEFLSPGSGDTGLRLDLPRIGIEPAQVNPDPGGDPLRLPVAGQAYPPQSGNIATATVHNNVASYAAA